MYRHQNVYVLIHTTDAVVVHYSCEFYSFATYNFRKSSKDQLIHTRLYHTIYHCIVIHKWQYIDTPKLCIVASLTYVRT